jgi:hypothetical protein
MSNWGIEEDKTSSWRKNRQWRYLINYDLMVKSTGVRDGWYQAHQDRKGWFKPCQEGVVKDHRNTTYAANI